jgi:hypothetical protein
MVSYGPWVEPTEHTETITLGPGIVDVVGDVRSGIVFDRGRASSKSITRGSTAPPVASIAKSEAVWAELVDLPLEDRDGSLGSGDASVAHTGDHEYFFVGDYYWQTDSWEVRSMQWDVWQSANATPPTLPPGAFDIEWAGGTRQPPALLELTVEQLGAANGPQWGVRYAAEGHPELGTFFGAGLSLNQLMHGGWPGWDGDGAHTWTEGELAHVQSLLTPLSTGRPPRSDPRWPALALGWAGGYPGSDPVPALAHGPYNLDYTWAPTMRMTLRFLRQRHRFVYLEDETVQRTFPRDDGLAGGAQRNWPASRSYQAGNRTSGGHW